MTYTWTKELEKEENNREFSQLVHNYYKLSMMRIMQSMREKYNIPNDQIQPLMMAIMARMMNESCYTLGAQIKEGYPINKIYSKDHLLNLVRILNGGSLSHSDRKDIDTDIKSGLDKFQEFIKNNATDFYVDGE